MRIIVYSGSPDISLRANAGYSTHLRGMIEGFEENGHEVHPLIMGDLAVRGSDDSTGSSLDAGNALRARVREVLPRPLWNTVRDARDLASNRQGLRALERLAHDVEPELIYERTSALHKGAYSIAAKHGCRYVTENNAPPSERHTFDRSSPLDSLVQRRLVDAVQNSDSAVYISSALRGEIESLSKRPLTNGLIVPNCTSRLHIGGDQNRDSRDSSMTTQIVYVGSMIDWHRVDILLSAAHSLHAEGYGINIVVVGDGENRSALESMTMDLELQDIVTFTGMVSPAEVMRRLRQSDIAVMPAGNTYASPIKLLEYAAAELPIIAPDTGPVREILRAGQDAVLVAPSHASLTAALKRLIENPELARRIALSAKGRVAEHFVWPRAARRVIDHLERPAEQ